MHQIRARKLLWKYGEKYRPILKGAGVVQAGSCKKPEIYSPANVHAFFSIQTVKLCTRLLCAVAKTSPAFFYVCFLPDFFES